MEELESGNHELVRKLHEESFRALRDVGDPYYQSYREIGYGLYLVRNDAVEEGRALLEKGVELARASQSPRPWDVALGGLAEAAFSVGDVDAAEAYAVEQLRVTREYRNQLSEAIALKHLGRVALKRGELAQAESHLMQALQLAWESQSQVEGLSVLVFLAELMSAKGQLGRAVAWSSLVIDHPGTERHDRKEAQRLLNDLRGRLPPGEFAAAAERGRERTLEEVVDDLLPVR